MAYRSLPPLPISTWINIRVLSIEATFRRVTSLTRKPAACGRQRDAVAQSFNRFQEAHDFLGAHDRGKPLGLAAENNPFDRLLLSHGAAMKNRSAHVT